MELFPIGEVKIAGKPAKLLIYENYRDGLKDIDQFSHLLIFWWITENEDKRSVLQSTPPFEYAPKTGVFSSRSPVRPNLIGMTVINLLDVDFNNGELEVDHIDAFEDTPIIDIKPYIPNSEHVPLEKVRVPSWFEELNVPRH